MKTIARARIAALLCVALVTPCLLADAEGDYRTLFGAEEKKVAATRSTLDDVAFAKKLLQAAGALGDSADLLKLVCRKAIDFGMKHHSGYATAREAIGLLAKSFPDQAEHWARKKFEIVERQYKGSYGSARKAAATPYLNVLLDRAEALAAGDKPDQALALYTKAYSIATYVHSEQTKRIGERRRELATQIARKRKHDAKLKMMEAKLAANPKDARAREALILYHLCESGDMAAATKLLTTDVDESFRTYIPLAGKPLAQLLESDCAELGHWYKSLADKAAGQAKATMLARAQAYYARFLSLHPKRDATALKVRMALRQVEADLAKGLPKPKGPPKPKASVPAKWTDLLRLVNPTKHALRGTWTMERGALKTTAAPLASLYIPIKAPPAYELAVRLTRQDKVNAVHIVFPVGSSRCRLGLDAFAGKKTAMDMVDGAKFGKGPLTLLKQVLTNDKDNEVKIRVAPAGKETMRFEVEVNSVVLFRWSGKPSAVVAPGWGIAPMDSVGFAAMHTTLVVRSVRMRKLPPSDWPRP